MDLMEPIWLMYLAHMESEKKSTRTGHAWETARQKARAERKPIGNNPPCWLRKLPTGYHFIPERVAAVRRAVQLLLSGNGFRTTCRILESEGVEPPSAELALRRKDTTSTRERHWTPEFLATLSRLVRSWENTNHIV